MPKDLISLKTLAHNIRNMQCYVTRPYTQMPYANDDVERAAFEAFQKHQDQLYMTIEKSLDQFANEIALQIELSISEETPCLLCRESDADPLGIGHHEDLFKTLKEIK